MISELFCPNIFYTNYFWVNYEMSHQGLQFFTQFFDAFGFCFL